MRSRASGAIHTEDIRIADRAWKHQDQRRRFTPVSTDRLAERKDRVTNYETDLSLSAMDWFLSRRDEKAIVKNTR